MGSAVNADLEGALRERISIYMDLLSRLEGQAMVLGAMFLFLVLGWDEKGFPNQFAESSEADTFAFPVGASKSFV